jgi:putative flavoprotein involved in K+ transport
MFWRDLVAFTWNVKTLEGRDEIAAMLRAQLAAANPVIWRIDGEPTQLNGVTEAWIVFETELVRGRGILRLKDGRAWTLLTAIEELKSFEERKGRSRPMGVTHGAHRRDKSWLDARGAEEEALGKETQPYCVVVGGDRAASRSGRG